MANWTFHLAGALAAATLIHHAQAQSAATGGAATVVVREGMAVRASEMRASSQETDGRGQQQKVRTVTRPCNPAEPAIVCTLVLIEVQ